MRTPTSSLRRSTARAAHVLAALTVVGAALTGCTRPGATETTVQQASLAAPVKFTNAVEMQRWFTTTAAMACTGDVAAGAVCTDGNAVQWRLKWAPAGDGDDELLAADCAAGRVAKGARVITDHRTWTLRLVTPDQPTDLLQATLRSRGLTETSTITYCPLRHMPSNMRLTP
jgi:hypothetical protein